MCIQANWTRQHRLRSPLRMVKVTSKFKVQTYHLRRPCAPNREATPNKITGQLVRAYGTPDARRPPPAADSPARDSSPRAPQLQCATVSDVDGRGRTAHPPCELPTHPVGFLQYRAGGVGGVWVAQRVRASAALHGANIDRASAPESHSAPEVLPVRIHSAWLARLCPRSSASCTNCWNSAAVNSFSKSMHTWNVLRFDIKRFPLELTNMS